MPVMRHLTHPAVTLAVFTLMMTLLLPPSLHGAENLKGRSMPRPPSGPWYCGEGSFRVEDTRGKRWVLFLVKTKNGFASTASTLNSIHRAAKDGGPVVVALTNEDARTVRNAIDALPSPPKFFLGADRGGSFAKRYSSGTYPEMFVVGSDGRVSWQGTPRDSRYRTLILDLMSGNKKPEVVQPEKRDPRRRQLPADYRERVDEAIERAKTKDMVELLLMAHSGDKRPRHPVPGRLWDELTKQVAEYEAAVRKRMDKHQREFAGFPPASRFQVLWEELATIECSAWLSSGESKLKQGDAKGARKDLERIVRNYPENSHATKARELLQIIEDDKIQ